MADAMFSRYGDLTEFINAIQNNIQLKENDSQTAKVRFEIKILKKLRCIVARGNNFPSHKIVTQLMELVMHLVQPVAGNGNRQVQVAPRITLALASWVLYGMRLLFKEIKSIQYYSEDNIHLPLMTDTLKECAQKLKRWCQPRLPNWMGDPFSDWSQLNRELEASLNEFLRSGSIAAYLLGEIQDDMCARMAAAASFDDFVPKTEEGNQIKCSVCQDEKKLPGEKVCILAPCFHAMCPACVITWFNVAQNNKCPECERETASLTSTASFQDFKVKQQEFMAEREKRQGLRRH